MSRRAKNGRRDRYGRYRGKGGIKPWKNNNPDFYRKGKRGANLSRSGGRYKTQGKSNLKRNLVIGAVATGAVAGAGYGAYKFKQSRNSKAVAGSPRPLPMRRMGASVPVGSRPRLRSVRNAVPGGTVPTGATQIAGRAAPTAQRAPTKAAKAGVVAAAPVSVAPPQAIKTPNRIDAASVVSNPVVARAVTGIVASGIAARVSAPGSSDDSDDVSDKKAYWERVEAARQKGIPRAAEFVSSGGNPGNYSGPLKAKPPPASIFQHHEPNEAAPSKPKQVRKPKAPTVTKAAPPPKVEPPKQQKVSFVVAPTAVHLKSANELKLTNEAGNRIRKMPLPFSDLKSRPGIVGQVTPKAPATPAKVGPPTTVAKATAPVQPVKANPILAGVQIAPAAAAPKRRGRPKTATSDDVLSPAQIAKMKARAIELAEQRKLAEGTSAPVLDPTLAVKPVSPIPVLSGKRISTKPITQGGTAPPVERKMMSQNNFDALHNYVRDEDDLLEFLDAKQTAGVLLPRDARTLLTGGRLSRQTFRLPGAGGGGPSEAVKKQKAADAAQRKMDAIKKKRKEMNSG